MHKQLINEAIINLIIEPDGPILIKAGESGADPTRPDMEFVRTHYDGKETIYLPGSSLKGILRSHCERIARTVDNGKGQLLSCNPLAEGDKKGQSDFSCNAYFETTKEKIKKIVKENKQTSRGAEIYRRSCFVCQMYGNTALASHVQITDAYPVEVDKVITEQRNGVPIDRFFGTVIERIGTFQFEVATQGTFKTEIYIKNFTTFQLGLLALALRDLQMQRIAIGFAKSRGLGRVKANVDSVLVRYPSGTFWPIENGSVYGVGALPCETNGYGFRTDDSVTVADVKYETDDWGSMTAELKGMDKGQPIYNLWTDCVKQWGKVVCAE